MVSTSAPYIDELQRYRSDPKAFFHLPSDCGLLASMHGAATYGLDRMSVVHASIAFVVVSPREAVRPDTRCPHLHSLMTDDPPTKGYVVAARFGRLGNLLSHLFSAISQSLQASGPDVHMQNLSDASLQTFAFMSVWETDGPLCHV